MQKKIKDISIVIHGAAGQGLKTIELFLAPLLLQHTGFYVFSTSEYMSRIRGGDNSVEIHVSTSPVLAFVERIDLLISMNRFNIDHLCDRITKNTTIIADHSLIAEKHSLIQIPLLDNVQNGNEKTIPNSIVIGIVLSLFAISPTHYIPEIKKYFSKATANQNQQSIEYGYQLTDKLCEEKKLTKYKLIATTAKQDHLISGAEAIAAGAISGGCNFVTAYPMSPGTSVFTHMAKAARDRPIIIEQVEDEISAANMALGAWYAGARAMITTAGGGFALMCETISLAGMIETPLVVLIGQRPGPATGLPTRTEQSDLNLVLYAGHGEFPRIILAPGTPQEAFQLTQKAFNLADKFQVPVFILADQFFLDSLYCTDVFDLTQKIETHIIKTDSCYQRYQLTEDGISPRGIPNYGDGIVCVDSDEHNETGYIAEDKKTRITMQNKRLKKLESIKKYAYAPTFIGSENFTFLVVCWGSNYGVVQETLQQLNTTSFAMLHFAQLYPLHPEAKKYLHQAHKIIMVENNSSGQFDSLLHREFNVRSDHLILQYDGSPFSVEGLTRQLQHISNEK